MRLAYLILYVADVAQTVAFYELAFGLTCRFRHEDQYAEMETGATALAFAQEGFVAQSIGVFAPNRSANPPAGAEIGLVAADVHAAYDKAVQQGGVPQLPPTQKPWGQIVSYVRDNNGFLVEICSAMG